MGTQNNDQIRLARMEAVCNKLRSDMDDVMQKAYEQAVADQDEERAAEMARRIRNKLLYESDKECVLDKVLPEPPKGILFTDWLSWLKDLAGIVSNEWGNYRQHLRDITKQEGFPFNIDWGVSPDAEKPDEEE